MIEVQGLWKSFGSFTALRDVNLTVEFGSIAGFLGPNGAGKSTTMKILTTYLPPGRGSVRVAGIDVQRDPSLVCSKLGYLPEQAAFYPELRVEEYLKYRAVLKGVPSSSVRSRVDRVMDECAIDGVRRKLLATLSRGYRQRVGLADSLLNEPEVLVLDEPTAGLDPLQVIEVRKLIAAMRGKRTVLLSSHVLGEVEQVCDTVIIIHKGEIRCQESRDSWQARLRSTGSIHLTLAHEVAAAAGEIRSIGGVLDVVQQARNYTIRATRDVRLELYRLAVARRWEILELHSQATSLEDLFVHATSERAVAP